jgi:hypothetical protein
MGAALGFELRAGLGGFVLRGGDLACVDYFK